MQPAWHYRTCSRMGLCSDKGGEAGQYHHPLLIGMQVCHCLWGVWDLLHRLTPQTKNPFWVRANSNYKYSVSDTLEIHRSILPRPFQTARPLVAESGVKTET